MTYTEQDKKLIEEFQNFADSIVWSNDDGSEKYIGVGNMADWWLDKIHQAIAEERVRVGKTINALDGHYTNVTNEKDVYERGFAVGYDTGWNNVLLKLRTDLLSQQQSNPNKNI